MDRSRYDALLRTFFGRDPAATLAQFAHALGASNPDLAAALDAVQPAFDGTDDWSSPLHLENVRGPASSASLVGAVSCLLKNPNLATAAGSQASGDLEREAVTELAALVFGRGTDAGGVFTAGGTHSNLYGARLGVETLIPGAMAHGFRGKRVVGVASEASHYSNRTVAGWLGLGTRNLHLVPTDRTLAVRLDALADTLNHLYRDGTTVAYVVATFGTTDGFGCDDVAGVRAVLEDAAARHGVPPPHLHADAAVGWALAFFTDYDAAGNPLRFAPGVLPAVRRAQHLCRGLAGADSVTVDFHKMGYGHYPASAVLVKRRADLLRLAPGGRDVPYFPDLDPARDPALYTLETSRPGLGPYIVAASLRTIGVDGYRMLVGRSLELAHALKRRLADLPHCVVLNPDAVGGSVLFWVLPKGTDARTAFARLERGEMPPAEARRCFAEVRRLFAARERTLDPARDARLGFTTDCGYRPHGYAPPAWKAVFFHPRTDEAVIDRLIEGIAAL